MGRGLSIILCTVLLSGCALPVPVQIASWALDGISFLATKKSIADHGISLVANKDCALWRGLKGDEVCSEFDDGGTFAVAANDATISKIEETSQTNEPEDDVEALASFDTAAGAPDIAPALISNTVYPADEGSSQEGQRLLIAGKRIWSERLDADLYFVIGSFSERNNARRLVKKYDDLGPAVMASRLDGVEVYRVAIGPFTGDQKRKMRLTLKKAGVRNSWAMRIDHRNWLLASPKELLGPEKTVAEVPEKPKKAKPAPKSSTNPEIADTPDREPTSIPTSQLIEEDKRYLVIGSFSSADNAHNFARTKASLSPRVLSAETAHGWRHRVVIGPYTDAEGKRVRRHIVLAEIDQIWALNLNPDDIIGDTLLAKDTEELDRIEDEGAQEIAETPDTSVKEEFSKKEEASDPLGDEMGWGVNLVKNILNMFRSTDSTDIVGVIASLES